MLIQQLKKSHQTLDSMLLLFCSFFSSFLTISKRVSGFYYDLWQSVNLIKFDFGRDLIYIYMVTHTLHIIQRLNNNQLSHGISYHVKISSNLKLFKFKFQKPHN